jgi:hypothetical protein
LLQMFGQYGVSTLSRSIDEGFSGGMDSRPALDRLMRDVDFKDGRGQTATTGSASQRLDDAQARKLAVWVSRSSATWLTCTEAMFARSAKTKATALEWL